MALLSDDGGIKSSRIPADTRTEKQQRNSGVLATDQLHCSLPWLLSGNAEVWPLLTISAHNFRKSPVESTDMKILITLLSGLLLWAAIPMVARAGSAPAYVDKVGELVTVFVNKELNYRLDLTAEEYTYINFTERLPNASFAAIRFRPSVFSLVVVETQGAGSNAALYAEMVQLAMMERIGEREDSEYKGYKDLGSVDERGMQVFQKVIYADVSSMPVIYVISAIVDGDRAYQLLTFATNSTDDVVKQEADTLLASFSIIDRTSNSSTASIVKSSRDYRSETFGYRFRARGKVWFDWEDVKETNEGADVGALSSLGYGAVVMPVCWRGAPPTDDAVYRVIMQQFGEDYPSEFITGEHNVKKGDATGKLLIGIEESDGEDFLYHQWIVVNDNCAYTLAAWGPVAQKNIARDLNKLWSDFQIKGSPTALDGQYTDPEERLVNAYLLNALGLHYFDARSFRGAFRFFSHANELGPSDEAYLMNSLRALGEIDAYREAVDWLQPRIAPFADSQVVQSWDAWLAYQTNDTGKAVRIYRELFAAGYRDDDDFSAFVAMLADAGQWQELDSVYATYTAGGVNDKTKLLQVQLLSRRGQHDAALVLLDEMTKGRPFNADLVYERMSILDDKGSSAEVLVLANSLIEKGYRSLQSYYYKGDAEFQLRSYRVARKSFEEALTFSPGNTTIREYLEAIDLKLGQGDISTINTVIDAVLLPKYMQRIFMADDVSTGESGYGAEFLDRIIGYDFNGGETLTETMYRKIRVIDDNGISQFSTLEFDFDPSYEHLYVNSLVVRNTDGEVLAEGDLNSYYITNNEDGYEASTEKTVHLPVPSLVPGVIIEVVVSKLTSVEENSFPLETIYMAANRPIGYSALFITGQSDQVQYQTSGVPNPRKRGGALVWELKTPVSFRWEPLQPFFDQLLPWVMLGTVGQDWQAVGVEYLQKIEDKLDVDKMSERAARLVEGIDNRLRKIEVLSAYVQDEIHYEAIEFGRRAFIPKTARETMRDRYGDCKDHAVLLYAMLESVGIDASLALVNLQQKVVPGLPNTDQFNHMIVSVNTESGRVFIDATDKDMRLGQLPPRSMAGNYALVLGDKTHLVKIPEYESQLTGMNVERVVEPGEDGSIGVTETARFTGYQAAELRGQLRTIETSQMQASLQRWVATRYSDAELTDYFVENVFDAGYDLIVEIQYSLPLDPDGSFDIPGFLEAYYLEFDRVADRRFPFEFSYPLRVSATTSVKIPPGHKLDVLTRKPVVGESRFGNWSREVNRAEGVWEIKFDYVASRARFKPEDYRDFAEFQRKAVDAIEQPLVLRRQDAAIKNGP